MTFSLDLTKPLSRVGLIVNLVFLTVVFSAISWLSFGFMTNTLPTSSAHEEEQAIAQKVQDQTFSKLKAAAKGNTTALALTGKNDVAKGGVAFNYQTMRLSAAKQIPTEYAKKILLTK